MQVVVNIHGRDAIPVRALPWITGWHFGALDVAEALAHEKEYETFNGLDTTYPPIRAFTYEDWQFKDWPVDAWVITCQDIEEAEELATTNEDWRFRATRALPSGVFVWKDEWIAAYNNSAWGPVILEMLQEDGKKYQQEIRERTIVFDVIGNITYEISQLISAREALHSSGQVQATELAEMKALLTQTLSNMQLAPGIEGEDESLKSVGQTQLPSLADPQRRLARLRELGGSALFKHGEWHFSGVTALVKAEASEGRKRRSEKTIRDDLRAAAELERQEQREGRLFSGLGAR